MQLTRSLRPYIVILGLLLMASESPAWVLSHARRRSPIDIKAKGTYSGKAASSPLSLTGIALENGSTLVVCVSQLSSVLTGLNWGGLSLTQAVSKNYAAGASTTAIYYGPNVPAGTNTLTFSFSTSPSAVAITVMEVMGIAGIDITSSSSGTGTAASDTGVATSDVREIYIGCLGTNGPSSDAPSTWNNSWTALQSIGTSGGGATSNVTTRDAYRIFSGQDLSSQASAILGLSRDWGLVHATFK